MPRERRRAAGPVSSFLVHLLLLLLLVPVINRDMIQRVSRGAPSPSNHGGGGGGFGGYISLPAISPPAGVAMPAVRPSIPPPEVVKPPAPQPVPTPPADTSTVTSAPPSAEPSAAAPGDTGAGPGKGGGQGGGTGGGVGPGQGPGAGPGQGGEGGRGIGPQQRQMVLPPTDVPKDLRGQEFSVTFWVDTVGRVLKVQVEPEIRDKDFAKRFIERMQQYHFRPARGPDGSVIPATATLKVTVG